PPARQLARERAGAVRAAVVDEEHLGPARVVLGEQGRQARGQHLRLVAGRDDDTDGRPGVRRPRGRQPDGGPPEEALAQQEPQPRGEGSRRAPRNAAHVRNVPLGGGRKPPIDYRDRVKIALMDSAIGLLAATAAVRRLRPDADLVLSLDPDGMPWGPRTPQDLTERALAVAEAAAAHRPDALVVGCNTATVHALTALRARLEPG